VKFVVAPDAFKGSLSAAEAAAIMRDAILATLPTAKVQCVPMADGGEGTLDALVASTQGHLVRVAVRNAQNQPCETCYGVLGDGETAVIEVAQVVGLTTVPERDRNPFTLTTYGVGQLIAHALEAGYRKLVIGLGGSATNDGGFGLLQALGVEFFNAAGVKIPPFPAGLKEIHRVSFDHLLPAVSKAEIWLASDVDNPLCGKDGCSAVFGPQKGATPKDIAVLDEALAHYADVIEAERSGQWRHCPGAGAAGGMGFALQVLGAKMGSGAKLVAEYCRLDQALADADWVFTGEGRTDPQTARGKVPHYVGTVARRLGIPCVLISGSFTDGVDALYDTFVSVHAAVNCPMSVADAVENAEALLFSATRNVARFICRASSIELDNQNVQHEMVGHVQRIRTPEVEE
jgi:glycerate kinase